MQSNTKKAAEVVKDSMDIALSIHAIDGELEMYLDDYDAGRTANIDFDHSDGKPMANITLSGETSEVSIWVDKSDAYALTDLFEDLAKDIERREE